MQKEGLDTTRQNDILRRLGLPPTTGDVSNLRQLKAGLDWAARVITPTMLADRLAFLADAATPPTPVHPRPYVPDSAIFKKAFTTADVKAMDDWWGTLKTAHQKFTREPATFDLPPLTDPTPQSRFHQIKATGNKNGVACARANLETAAYAMRGLLMCHTQAANVEWVFLLNYRRFTDPIPSDRILPEPAIPQAHHPAALLINLNLTARPSYAYVEQLLHRGNLYTLYPEHPLNHVQREMWLLLLKAALNKIPVSTIPATFFDSPRMRVLLASDGPDASAAGALYNPTSSPPLDLASADLHAFEPEEADKTSAAPQSDFVQGEDLDPDLSYLLNPDGEDDMVIDQYFRSHSPPPDDVPMRDDSRPSAIHTTPATGVAMDIDRPPSPLVQAAPPLTMHLPHSESRLSLDSEQPRGCSSLWTSTNLPLAPRPRLWISTPKPASEWAPRSQNVRSLPALHTQKQTVPSPLARTSPACPMAKMGSWRHPGGRRVGEAPCGQVAGPSRGRDQPSREVDRLQKEAKDPKLRIRPKDTFPLAADPSFAVAIRYWPLTVRDGEVFSDLRNPHHYEWRPFEASKEEAIQIRRLVESQPMCEIDGVSVPLYFAPNSRRLNPDPEQPRSSVLLLTKAQWCSLRAAEHQRILRTRCVLIVDTVPNADSSGAEIRFDLDGLTRFTNPNRFAYIQDLGNRTKYRETLLHIGEPSDLLEVARRSDRPNADTIQRLNLLSNTLSSTTTQVPAGWDSVATHEFSSRWLSTLKKARGMEVPLGRSHLGHICHQRSLHLESRGCAPHRSAPACGAKLWFIAKRKSSLPPTDMRGLMRSRHAFDGFDGYMPATFIHSVLTTEHSIANGRHGIAASNLSNCVLVTLHNVLLSAVTTNADHEPARRFLIRIFIFIAFNLLDPLNTQADPLRAAPTNANLRPPARAESLLAHLPDITTVDGLLDLLALQSFVVLYMALSSVYPGPSGRMPVDAECLGGRCYGVVERIDLTRAIDHCMDVVPGDPDSTEAPLSYGAALDLYVVNMAASMLTYHAETEDNFEELGRSRDFKNDAFAKQLRHMLAHYDLQPQIHKDEGYGAEGADGANARQSKSTPAALRPSPPAKFADLSNFPPQNDLTLTRQAALCGLCLRRSDPTFLFLDHHLLRSASFAHITNVLISRRSASINVPLDA
ncbi:hypothetical protein R3P38DRAFT_3201506 [Favolaschia claudopus]|uniref:Uncharacterized protein n=1 Tax=Favolaschia claudopus TaxID=2862362 RepID=A0AAW0AYQ5_9AGAR